MEADGVTVKHNGKVVLEVKEKCKFAPRKPVGEDPAINTNIEYSWSPVPTNATGYDWVFSFGSRWTVPAKPTYNPNPDPITNKYTVVFLWNGVQDGAAAESSTVVLQSVLQFGKGLNPIVGGNKWIISSVFGGPNWGNQYFHSTPVDVNVGDTVKGVQYVTQPCNTSGANCGWAIGINRTSADGQQTFEGTFITATPPTRMRKLFTGVLEGRNVTTCAQLRAGSSATTIFQGMNLTQPLHNPFDYTFQDTTSAFNGSCASTSPPCWNPIVTTPTPSPNCGWGVASWTTGTTLAY